MCNGTFALKQHCQRVGARITVYCSVTPNYRGWMCEKPYLESAYIFNLLKSFPSRAQEEQFQKI